MHIVHIVSIEQGKLIKTDNAFFLRVLKARKKYIFIST